MKTLKGTLTYSILLTIFLGVFVTLISSVLINKKIDDSIQLKNVDTIHKSLSDLIRNSLLISDFAEIQRTLGLINNADRKYGVFLDSGEWILSDYSLQPAFENTLQNYNLKSHFNKSILGSKNSYCSQLDNKSLLFSIQLKESSFFDIIKPNLWIIFILLGAMIFIGFIGTHLVNRKILNPFFNLHEELNGLKKKDFNLIQNHKINESREFTELSNIAIGVNDLLNKLSDSYLEIQIREKAVLISQVASQVSHDIRSPLAALSMILNQINQIPEMQRIIIRSSVNRINDIANDLLQKSKQINNPNELLINAKNIDNNLSSIQLLSPIIDEIVSEKRIQFRHHQGVELEADINLSYGLFVKINIIEFKRTISNLINNSIESFPNHNGKVVVGINKSKNYINVFIKDNGKGIPDHILKKLGQIGVTHGKTESQSGSGLGVYHAKKTVEASGGQFFISSNENLGTLIEMKFNYAPTPIWFVDKIEITRDLEIISLDDDISIHQVWVDRFEKFMNTELNITHKSFVSGSKMKEWLIDQKNNQTENHELVNRLYLVDYELLNQASTGLDLIEELGIGEQSILITSRFEEENIKIRCEKLNIKLIPKAMAAYVPIQLKTSKKLCHILIDDDQIPHMMWEMDAKEKKINFKGYFNPEDFFIDLDQFDLNSSIYIDSNLGNGVSGVDIAKKAYDLGFKNIHICTGYDPNDFQNIYWVKSVRGKEPFWG